MRQRISNYIRSGHAGLYLVSHEEARVESELKAVATSLKRPLYAWSATRGLVNTADGSSAGGNDPLEAVEAVNGLPEDALVMMADFHLFLQDGNPVLIRGIKDTLVAGKAKGRVLIILGCRQVLPPELEREFVVLDFSLPDKTALALVLDGICQSAKLKAPNGDERESLLDAACGLTTGEAENAFALSVVESKRVDPVIVAREKSLSVKKSGLLEIVDVKETLSDIGGLDLLKKWLLQRKDVFGERARRYKLPQSRGVLLLGVPGCGKTLFAKAAANVFQRPLIRMDIGALMGSLVGQSEANLRAAIRTAEAISPAVIILDEIDKGLAGSSGANDSGTSARVFGSLISWMQDRTAPLFLVATANQVSHLPPELLRKGRWDEIFWTDLPTRSEREVIWRLKIAQHGRDPSEYDVSALANASGGYTGAEIEAIVADSLFMAFSEKEREPTTADMQQALQDVVPLSKLSDQVSTLRQWAKGRARPATTPEVDVKGRKITA